MLGQNRIEVQMPLPPEENKRLRQEYIDAREALAKTDIKRSDLENTLRMPAAEREAAIVGLAAGIADRERAIRQAATAYDAYDAALASFNAAEAGDAAEAETAETQPAEAASPDLEDLRLALRDASEDYDDAIDTVLGLNFNHARFQENSWRCRPGQRRSESIKDFHARYATLTKQMEDAEAKFEAWRLKRAYLGRPGRPAAFAARGGRAGVPHPRGAEPGKRHPVRPFPQAAHRARAATAGRRRVPVVSRRQSAGVSSM